MQKKSTFLFLSLLFFHLLSSAQDNLGLINGNFSGITGVALQPASVADNRYKFDINLVSASINFDNNYLGFSRSFFVNNRFEFKGFQNYQDFKSKVLIENNLSGKKAYFNLNNRLQLPLSFMMTTGKKSGIALNIQSRTSVALSNINPDFAKQLYDFWGNKATHGQNYNLSGMQGSALNWMELGFTYGRVVLDAKKHFVKLGVTAKYLGGLSSWNLDAKNLTVRAENDSLFTGSGQVNFNHSESNISTRINSTYRPDASSWGGDLGVVYEFRGRVNRFLVPKYNKEDDYTESVARRDKNKYSVKLGVSLLDVGVLKFKSAPLARNFNLDVSNFNLAQVDIRNIRQFDTLLSKNVTYTGAVGQEYSVAMPTALSTQLDIHILKGFYVNAMMYKPLSFFNKNTNYRVITPDYYAITPRWESRLAGVYVPISMNSNKVINAGATLRVGPLFVGTGNMLTLIRKDNIKNADLHTGIKLPIAHGKPSKLSNMFKKFTNELSGDTVILKENKEIEIQSEKESNLKVKPQTQPIQIIINNYNYPNSGSKSNSNSKEIQINQGDTNQNIIIEENNIEVDEIKDLQRQIEQLKEKLNRKEELINELEKETGDNTGSKKKIDSLVLRYQEKVILPESKLKLIDTSVVNQNVKLDELLQELESLQAKNRILQRRQKENEMTLEAKLVELKAKPNADIYKVKELEYLKSTYNNIVFTDVKKSSTISPVEGRIVKAPAISYVAPSFSKTTATRPIDMNVMENRKAQSTSEIRTQSVDVSNLMTKSEFEILRRELESIKKESKTQERTQTTSEPLTPQIGVSNLMTKNEYEVLRRELESLKNEVKTQRQLQTVSAAASTGGLFRRRNKTINKYYDNSKKEPTVVKLVDTVRLVDTIYLEKPVERIIYKTVRDTIVNTIEKTNTITKVEKEIEKVVDNKKLVLGLAPEVILFDVGKFILKPVYYKKLIYIADQAALYPELKVKLTGHTDNSGNVEQNRILAANRAKAVSVYLQKRGLKKERILINSEGADNPLTENSTKDGKSQNRRVEVSFEE